MTTLNMTIQQKGSKFLHQVFLDGKLIGTRMANKIYAQAVVVDYDLENGLPRFIAELKDKSSKVTLEDIEKWGADQWYQRQIDQYAANLDKGSDPFVWMYNIQEKPLIKLSLPPHHRRTLKIIGVARPTKD